MPKFMNTPKAVSFNYCPQDSNYNRSYNYFNRGMKIIKKDIAQIKTVLNEYKFGIRKEKKN